jgi:cytochrome c oxidase subunit 4
MAETHVIDSQELVIESHVPTYLKVWFSLLVLTVIEYFYAHVFKDTFMVLVLGLMFWAVIKASLVGWYFMHLKFEGNWVYGFLVPACILATVLIFALVPDIGLARMYDESPAEEDVTTVAPFVPGPAGSMV